MAGGVERMASIIMNEMVSRGFRVGLITWDPADATPHYKLDKTIVWKKLDLGSAAKKASWRIRIFRQLALRRMAKEFRADVAIGFQVGTFIAARTAMWGMGIPMIAAERNSPDLFDFVKGGMRQRNLADLALRSANCVTVQLESYISKYPKSLRNRIITIPNPVQKISNPSFPNEEPNTPRRILNVGRLSFQKNQTFLVRSFALIAKKNPEWVLTLVGEGEKRVEIHRLIKELELQGQIELIGAVDDVDAWYQKSAFLVFPSLWEGFPNALVEAFRQGLPAIGLKNTSGVNELLQHRNTGLLTESTETSFASAIQSMIDDQDFRRTAGRNAHRSILRFAPETIFDEWASLFKSLAKKNSK